MKTIRVDGLEREHHVPQLMGKDIAVSNEVVSAATAEADWLVTMARREAARKTEEAMAVWERRIKKIVRERHVSRAAAIDRIGPAPYYTALPTLDWITIALLMHIGEYEVRCDRRE